MVRTIRSLLYEQGFTIGGASACEMLKEFAKNGPARANDSAMAARRRRQRAYRRTAPRQEIKKLRDELRIAAAAAARVSPAA